MRFLRTRLLLNGMDSLRATIEEALGKEAAAAYTPQDLKALLDNDYSSKGWLQSATREGLERCGLSPGKVDALLKAFTGGGASSNSKTLLGAETFNKRMEDQDRKIEEQNQLLRNQDMRIAQLRRNLERDMLPPWPALRADRVKCD